MKNPDELRAEIAGDNREFDRLRLTLDSDPRKTNSAGSLQQEAGVANETNGSDSET